MAEQKRRLAALLSADVAGYSRLMQDDEAATVETLTKYRDIFQEFVTRHDGRVVDSPGDNVLAEFASPVEAVQSAIDIQRELGFRNRQLADHRQMHFRIGVNLGDVIGRDDGTLYGDGVNVAARLEGLAEPGGIVISEDVHRHVEGKLEIAFADFGEHEVKNIAKPVKAFRIAEPGEVVSKTQIRVRAFPTSVLAAASSVVVVAVAIVIWSVIERSGSRQPTPTDAPVSAKLEDPVLAVPSGPAIAVLPFENLSGDSEQDYFSIGLTEDLIARLSRFGQFRVIARNSTAQYKGQEIDVRQIGRDLGAQFVVQGSVRRGGDRVRVSLQLLDTEDGTNLWAESYDRDLTPANLLDVQDDISDKVAATIADPAGIILRPDIEAIRTKPPSDLEAYECALRLQAYYDSALPEEHRNVRECAERAVRSDPNYAEAWHVLAQMYLDEHRLRYNPRPNPLDRALEAAQHAVELDPNNAEAQVVLAQTHFNRHEMDEFFAEADRAIKLNPYNSTGLAMLGNSMIFAGAVERGMALMNKAVAINPNYPSWYHFSFYHYHFLNRDYEQALNHILKANWPDNYWTYILMAAVYGQLGRLEEGQAAAKKLLDMYPDYPAHAREEFEIWNRPESAIQQLFEGLRKSGLDIPEQPRSTTN